MPTHQTNDELLEEQSFVLPLDHQLQREQLHLQNLLQDLRVDLGAAPVEIRYIQIPQELRSQLIVVTAYPSPIWTVNPLMQSPPTSPHSPDHP